MFIMNEDEGYQISGETEPEKILELMEEKYPNAEVVLTLGEKGAAYSHKKREFIRWDIRSKPWIQQEPEIPLPDIFWHAFSEICR